MKKQRRRPRLPTTIHLPPAWRRKPGVVAAFLLLTVLVVWSRQGTGATDGGDWARYHNKEFSVTAVVDGDTFDINAPDSANSTTRIRLWGVDTPETHGPNAPMYFGPEAADFARQTLRGRRVRILLHPDRTRGKYGRLLAYVELVETGESFNEMLLSGGYAYADWRWNHPMKRQYRELEKRARRAGMGLWAQVQPAQMPEWRQKGEDIAD